MSTSGHGGELHYLDIYEKDQYYNPGLVAEEVMWPLVDEMWHGDWRHDAPLGPDFVLPKTDYYEGRLLDVLLTADRYEFVDDDDHIRELHTVQLAVEEPINEEYHDMALELVKAALRENTQRDDSPEEDRYEYSTILEVLSEPDDGDVEVKKGWMLDLDSDGEYSIKTYRSIGDLGDHMIPPCSAEGPSEIGMHIRKHDLDTLAEASVVLGASNNILRGLAAVRQYPIDMY